MAAWNRTRARRDTHPPSLSGVYAPSFRYQGCPTPHASNTGRGNIYLGRYIHDTNKQRRTGFTCRCGNIPADSGGERIETHPARFVSRLGGVLSRPVGYRHRGEPASEFMTLGTAPNGPVPRISGVESGVGIGAGDGCCASLASSCRAQ